MSMRYLLVLLLFSPVCWASCREFRLTNILDLPQLWNDIAYLTSDALAGRKTETRGARLTRDYLNQRFSGLALDPIDGQDSFNLPFEYELTFGAISGVNVAAQVQGQSHADKFIVVSAHYDHLGTKGRKVYKGADDNASGVATLLSLAAHIKGQPLEHSVIFLASDAEERGLYGAKAFVRSEITDPDRYVLNLNLDMLGQGGRTNRLYVSASRQTSQLKQIIAQAKQRSGLCLVSGHPSRTRGFGASSAINWRKASDHAAFSAAGIPYLFVGVGVHGDYHTVNDTLDNLEPDFLNAAAQASLALLLKSDEVLTQAHKKAELE